MVRNASKELKNINTIFKLKRTSSTLSSRERFITMMDEMAKRTEAYKVVLPTDKS